MVNQYIFRKIICLIFISAKEAEKEKKSLENHLFEKPKLISDPVSKIKKSNETYVKRGRPAKKNNIDEVDEVSNKLGQMFMESTNKNKQTTEKRYLKRTGSVEVASKVSSNLAHEKSWEMEDISLKS